MTDQLAVITTDSATAPLYTQDWYKALVDECQAAVTEGIFTYRWALIKTYHDVGSRIIEDSENFDRAKIYGMNIVQHLAQSIGRSKRWIYYAIAVAETYPDINDIPGGKNMSMTKLIRDYLTDPKDMPAKSITYYDGMGEAVLTHRRWRVTLPFGSEVDLGGNSPIVRVILKEGP